MMRLLPHRMSSNQTSLLCERRSETISIRPDPYNLALCIHGGTHYRAGTVILTVNSHMFINQVIQSTMYSA